MRSLTSLSFFGCFVAALTPVLLLGQAFDSTWTLRAPSPAGSAWMAGSVNGAGGVLVGEQGAIASSADGLAWTVRTSGSLNTWRGVVTTGAQLVAVGEHGAIATSANGTSWTLRDAPSSRDLRAVAWNGSALVAVGEHGEAIRSTDSGVSWAMTVSATSQRLSGIAALGATLVAVGDAGAVMTSADGLTWTSQASGSTAYLNAIASSGARLVAVGDGGVVLTSTDGTAWTVGSAGVTTNLLSVGWTGTNFLAVGDDGSALSSSDGSAWTARATGSSRNFSAVFSTGTVHVIAGQMGQIYSSTNLAAWTSRQSGAVANLYAVASDGSTLVAVGAGGLIRTSADGVAWTTQASGSTAALFGVAAGNGRYVACGEDGVLLLSTNNGATWSPQASGTTETLKSIVYNDSVWVAVGANGTHTVSSNANATSWSDTRNGEFHFTDVAWTGSVFVAVGNDGAISTSPDGSAWTARTSGTEKGLSGVAWTGGQVVAVGDDGSVLISPTGTTWSDARLPPESYGEIDFTHLDTLGSYLLATGYRHQGTDTHGIIATSPNGTTWTLYHQPTPALNSLALTATRAFAVGSTGTLLSSGSFVLPDVGFATASSSASEGDTTVDVIVQLSTPATTDVLVPFTVDVASTATAGSTADYTVAPVPPTLPASNIVTFAIGQSTSIIRLTLREDDLDESDETVVLRLVGPAGGATLAGTLTHTFTLQDDDTAPSVTVHDVVDRLVPVGSDVSYSVTASGDLPLSYKWLKNGSPISKQTASSLTLNDIATTGFGSYSVEISNHAGTVTLGPVDLALVDTSAKSTAVVFNRTTSAAPFTANVYARLGSIGYQWRRGAVPVNLLDDGRITGSQTKTVTLRLLTIGDADTYTCLITRGALTLASGVTTLSVIIPPVIQTNALPSAMVSESYSQPIVALNTPTSYSATGLPRGLVCNSKTGLITGRAQVSGTFDVVIKASNTAGSSPTIATIPLVITPLPTGTVGTWTATAERHAMLNASLGGTVSLKTTATGTYTGKVILGAKSYSISGALDSGAMVSPSITKTIPRTGTTALTFTATLDPALGSFSGTITDPTPNSVAFAGKRAMVTPLTLATGLHTFALPLLNPGDVGVASIPQGYSSGSLRVATTGAVTGTATLADGTLAAFAAPVAHDGEVVVFKAIYSNQGSLLGKLSLGAAPAGLITTAGISWYKATQTGAATAATVRSYGAGFGPIALDAFGGLYVIPLSINGDIVMDLLPSAEDVPNARLVFDEGGAPDPTTRLPYAFRLSSTATRDPQTPATNPGLITLSITATTGAFSGSFRLTDPDPTTSPASPWTRSSTFKGTIVRDPANVKKGYGYFTLPELPQNLVMPFTTRTTSSVLSGSVVMEKL